MSFEMTDQAQLNQNSIGIVEFRGRLPDAVRELQVSLGQFCAPLVGVEAGCSGSRTDRTSAARAPERFAIPGIGGFTIPTLNGRSEVTSAENSAVYERLECWNSGNVAGAAGGCSPLFRTMFGTFWPFSGHPLFPVIESVHLPALTVIGGSVLVVEVWFKINDDRSLYNCSCMID